MKKVLILTVLAALTLTAYAEALEYNIDPPAGASYGKATSIEVVHTRDNGERKNADISKNAALIPPGFGTPRRTSPAAASTLLPTWPRRPRPGPAP